MNFSILIILLFLFATNIRAANIQPETITRKLLYKDQLLTPYISMNEKRLLEIKPFISDALYLNISDWVHARDALNAIWKNPEGNYDPINYLKWQPDSISIKKGIKSGDTESILVKEYMRPGKIYAGYYGVSKYIFKRKDQEWKLENVEIKRKNISSSGGIDINIMNNLNKEASRFKEIKNNLEIQK